MEPDAVVLLGDPIAPTTPPADSSPAEGAKPAAEAMVARAGVLGISTVGLREACGCEECFQSGYAGRVGIFSYLPVSDVLREAIRHEASEAEVEEIARVSGFQTLSDAACELIASGLTSLEEAERTIGPILKTPGGAPPVPAREAPKATGSGITRPKVLLIDDDEDTREVLAMVLAREFYDVVQAANGLEALERVFESPPDAIVCDLMMPKMNGAEFLQRLQRDNRTRSIPVLMLTAAGTPENEISLISSGASDFVAKGSDMKIMLARLGRLLTN